MDFLRSLCGERIETLKGFFPKGIIANSELVPVTEQDIPPSDFWKGLFLSINNKQIMLPEDGVVIFVNTDGQGTGGYTKFIDFDICFKEETPEGCFLIPIVSFYNNSDDFFRVNNFNVDFTRNKILDEVKIALEKFYREQSITAKKIGWAKNTIKVSE